jgi:signal transduction histidine kinase
MTLQAKLTLGTVVLASLMVGVVSAVDLGNEMQRQFESTLERAETLKAVASRMIQQSINRQRTKTLRDALLDPDLQSLMIDIITSSHAILEVAAVDPATTEILLDSDPTRLNMKWRQYDDFQPVVVSSSWWTKLQVLLKSPQRYYQLEQPLGTAEQQPLLSVRVLIAPTLIRRDINPTMQKDARVALLLVIGAVILTFVFSALAFRPLGRLGHLLDQVARGEYDPEKMAVPQQSGDELAVMASKVSLLGQRLRGAQYEVSDLRGNIDRLLQDLEDAVFIFNRELRLVFASGSVEKFLGTERSGLVGKTITEVFQPNQTLSLLIAQASQTRRPIRNRRVPIPGLVDGRGPSVVLLSVDMLESLPGSANSAAGLLVRLRDPEAQRKIGRELQTADRLSAISRVSGGVAHEVKNPLNAILLHVEVARAKLANGDTEVESEMEIISREILRLDRVVKTFLDFTRPVELNLTTVPVQELVSEILELARPQAESSQIKVAIAQEVDGTEVRVDRDLLKQAFLNIVVNALQAMPEGGELGVQSLVNEDTAEIRISDTGPGIPAELREKIFRLYFTTKKEGSGIGLAMAFRIVQLHDGTIDFTSEPGKGTTFFIRLPLAV